jgi:hypothetical protein
MAARVAVSAEHQQATSSMVHSFNTLLLLNTSYLLVASLLSFWDLLAVASGRGHGGPICSLFFFFFNNNNNTAKTKNYRYF